MSHLPRNASDADLLAFIDDWAALMETENYTAAYEYTDHAPEQGWTPELLRDVVKAYGDAEPNQRVTLLGVPSDVAQRKILRQPSISDRCRKACKFCSMTCT